MYDMCVKFKMFTFIRLRDKMGLLF